MSNPTLKDWQDACAVIDSAIAAERDRCAKICDSFGADMGKMARESYESRGDSSNSVAASLDAQSIAAGLLARNIRGEG